LLVPTLVNGVLQRDTSVGTGALATSIRASLGRAEGRRIVVRATRDRTGRRRGFSLAVALPGAHLVRPGHPATSLVLASPPSWFPLNAGLGNNPGTRDAYVRYRANN
jgi:hypothetical protein